MLITGATLVTRWGDPAPLARRAVRVSEGVVTAVGDDLTPLPGEDVVALPGGLLAPGLVCGHTHLYSALARGMPAGSPTPPTSFREILEKVWWQLDKALDAASIRASARTGALDALRCGTVGLVDHHASPGHVAGSLDLLAQELRALRVRSLLCYETSDRDGEVIRDAGVSENARFVGRGSDGWSAGLLGAHASFTLSDATLDALATHAEALGAGLHVHVAEGATDRAETAAMTQEGLLARFANRGLLRPGTVLAHCVDLSARELEQAHGLGCTLAHNPSSNLNNRVGFAPIWRSSDRVVLGTDGIGADLFSEAKMAYFRGAEATGALSPARVLAMVDASADLLYGQLGLDGGVVRVGAVADLIWLDYDSPTPLTADTLAGHFVFAMNAGLVCHVWVGGEAVVVDGRLTQVDEAEERAHAREQASALWARRT